MPYIERIELRMIDKFLVIASDGLWDVCTDQVFYLNKENIMLIFLIGSYRDN